MKNFKKITASALAIILAFGLVACNTTEDEPAETTPDAGVEEPTDPEETDEPDETDAPDETEEPAGLEFEGQVLEFAGLDGGYGTAGWDAVIAAFEEVSGATVEATYSQQIAEEIRPQITAGNGPDVIYNSVGQAGSLTETMTKEDMILDITDVFSGPAYGEDTPISDKMIGGFLENNTTVPYGDGNVYLAPMFYSPTGLWYNANLFTDNGGDYELPTTLEEFFALGDQAAADGISLFTYPTSGYFDSFVPALLAGAGGQELYAAAMEYDVDAWTNDATQVFETVGRIADYIWPDTVANAQGGANFTRNQLAVMNSEALFMPNGNWVISEMEDALGEVENFEWGFMALPAYEDGGDRYAFTFFEQAFVSADTDVPELAKAFVSYLYSDEAVQLFAENGNAVQPVNGAEEYLSDDSMKLIFSVYEGGAQAAMGGFVSAPTVEGVDMNAALYATIDSVMNGDVSVEEWQAGVVDAATQISEALAAE